MWQSLFNERSRMLGLSVGSQLLTAWDPSRLSQIVGGAVRFGRRKDYRRSPSDLRRSSLAYVRRVQDAQHSGAGRVRSPTWGVLAPLGRIGRWCRPVSGDRPARSDLDIREELRGKAKDGTEIPDDVSFLMRPRSFLLIGNLRRMIGTAGGGHLDKIRSFELYRRSISDPEIITFDELLVRARALAMMDLVLDPRGDD